jgi:hypothetical protein
MGKRRLTEANEGNEEEKGYNFFLRYLLFKLPAGGYESRLLAFDQRRLALQVGDITCRENLERMTSKLLSRATVVALSR